jgi:hypothetical protein
MLVPPTVWGRSTRALTFAHFRCKPEGRGHRTGAQSDLAPPPSDGSAPSSCAEQARTGSGVTLATASSINDHGVIVGTAVNAHGLDVGYELTPVN